MRIRTLLLAVLTAAAGLTTSSATTSIPRFAGKTNVNTASGSQAAFVQLPRAVTVNVQNPSSWIKLSPPTYHDAVGILIDAVRYGDPARRAGIFYARIGRPAGCDVAGACTPVETVATRYGADQAYRSPAGPTLVLQPGTYRVYVLGAYNPVKATLLFRELSGAVSIAARTTVQFSEDQEAQSPIDSILSHPERADLGGFMPFRSRVVYTIPGPVLLAGGVWRTKGMRDMPETPQSLASCWRHSKGQNLPDYWWQDPELVLRQVTDPVTASTPCTDESALRSDRAFERTSQEGQWTYRYQVPLLWERGQRYGAFVLAVRFLDAQG